MEYKTKQQDLILDFLKTAKGQGLSEHVTAIDVTAGLKKYGMGKATVYRHLERLVDKGVVNKYFVGENASACFELIKDGEHHKNSCYHCRCEQCGKLIHLHCEELDDLNQHLSSEHGFLINPFRTVIYGVCEECQKGDEENEK